MSLDRELIDRLLVESERPEEIIGENGPLKQLTKPLVKRVLAAELTAHLGYEMNAAEGRPADSSRNGAGGKRLKRRPRLRSLLPSLPQAESQARGRLAEYGNHAASPVGTSYRAQNA